MRRGLDRIDTTTSVDTPERVRFRHRVAGLGPRSVAWVLDGFFQAALYMGVLGIVALFAAVGPGFDDISTGALLLMVFVISWFYAAVFEYMWSGRTPGKWLVGVRVVQDDGSPITLASAVLRNLLRGMDGAPAGYAVGALVVSIDPKLRRLGDIVAGTVVVIEQRSTLLSAVTLQPPITDEERVELPVRVDLTPHERSAIERLLRRAPQLGPARAEELASYLAPVLSERTGVSGHSALRTVALAWARATGHDT